MNGLFETVRFPDDLPVLCYMHPLESYRLHWHKEVEFLVPIKGSFGLFVQDEAILVSEGEVAVISPGLIHATQSTADPNVILVVQVKPEALGGSEEMPKGMAFAPRTTDARVGAVLRGLLCSAMLEVVYKRQGYRHKALALVSDALALILREFPRRQALAPEDARQKERERMDRIAAYIDENFAAKLTLADIAAREHLSVNHLSTFIHRTLGMSFGDYLKFIRLKAYMDLLRAEPATSLDDIAARCGFSSPQYAATLFRDTYRVTPGKYRKRLSQVSIVRKRAYDADTTMGYVPQYQPEDLSVLLKYASQDARGARRADTPEAPETRDISCAWNDGEFCASAVRVAAIGRAHDGLLACVQECVARGKKELGFEYLRFHGMFSDDMMLLRPESSGSISYSWRSADMLLDFMTGIGVRPFIELTYMPSLLASGDKTVFLWRGNVTPPGDMHSWRRLVSQFVAHCAQRYGEDEVCAWYFEVWNDPDSMGVSWAGTMQEFFHFYAATAEAVLRALPGARVCGPSVAPSTESGRRWISAFLDFCQQKSVPLSALTLHAYPEIPRADGLRVEVPSRLPANVSEHDTLPQDYLLNFVEYARRQLAQRSMRIPVVATEWNITTKAYNPVNDSAFAATAMLRSALEADDQNALLCHWMLTDYMEESPLPAGELFGGFGLYTISGLRKPTFYAMRALSRLYRQVVYRDDALILTRSACAYRALCFHHPSTQAAFDIAYAQHATPSSEQPRAARAYLLALRDLAPGEYVITRSLYDAERSSPKAILRACGLSEPLADEDARWLSARARPERSRETALVEKDGILAISVTLCECSFEEIEILRM